MATQWFCFSRSVCVNICVCVSEGSAVLVRYRRSWILSESAAGGEDGALGQVSVHRHSLHMYVRRLSKTHGNLKASKTWMQSAFGVIVASHQSKIGFRSLQVSLEKVGSLCKITDIVSLGWTSGSSPLTIAICDHWKHPVFVHLDFVECVLCVRRVFQRLSVRADVGEDPSARRLHGGLHRGEEAGRLHGPLPAVPLAPREPAARQPEKHSQPGSDAQNTHTHTPKSTQTHFFLHLCVCVLHCRWLWVMGCLRTRWTASRWKEASRRRTTPPGLSSVSWIWRYKPHYSAECLW